MMMSISLGVIYKPKSSAIVVTAKPLKGEQAAAEPIAAVSKPHAPPVAESGTAKAAPAVQEPAAATPNDFDQLVGSGEKKQGTEEKASKPTALTPGPSPRLKANKEC